MGSPARPRVPPVLPISFATHPDDRHCVPYRRFAEAQWPRRPRPAAHSLALARSHRNECGPMTDMGDIMPESPLAGLNPDQLDAVVHADGPLLVVAGAGSGKTRVLTHRIAHLIHEGARPSSILAITFTNKAADEMRRRVAELVGPVAKTMWVSTFHSACVRILRAHADKLGYPRQFTIYDQADATRLTGYVIRDLGLDSKRFTPRGALGDQPVEERSRRPGRRGGQGAVGRHLRAQAGRGVRRVPDPAAGGRRDGLRRPARERRRAVPRLPRRPGRVPATLPARPRRRVPGHQPGPERASS